ncbi:MAG: response regulator transcription factor [Wolinella sp.]
MNNDILDTLKETTILLVEDDASLREAISCPLTRRCKEIYCASNGIEGLSLYREKSPHIVITDINLPELNGIKMAQEIRAISKDTPILIITAFGTEENLLSSFNINACSLLKKPIDLDELFIVLLANAKRTMAESVIAINDEFSYHTRTQRLYRLGNSIELTRKETKILDLLIKNRGNHVSYEEFQSRIWGSSPMTLDALRMHINSIRKKSFQDIVKNFSGVGYRFHWTGE